jgi:hypothetical protein
MSANSVYQYFHFRFPLNKIFIRLQNYAKFNKICFFGGFAAEKTPIRRALRARAPRGADKISDFVKRR